MGACWGTAALCDRHASEPLSAAWEEPARHAWTGCLLPLLPTSSLSRPFQASCAATRLFSALPAGTAWPADNYSMPMTKYPKHQPGDWRDTYRGHPCYTPGRCDFALRCRAPACCGASRRHGAGRGECSTAFGPFPEVLNRLTLRAALLLKRRRLGVLLRQPRASASCHAADALTLFAMRRQGLAGAGHAARGHVACVAAAGHTAVQARHPLLLQVSASGERRGRAAPPLPPPRAN